MRYVSVADFCRWFGFEEMAQLTRPDDKDAVSPDLLREIVSGEWDANWTDEQLDVAFQAAQRIDAVLEDASRLADGYLAVRYTLPLAADVIAASALPRMVGDLAHYQLYDDQEVAHITNKMKLAVDWLEGVSRGLVRLGADAPVQTTIGTPVIDSTPRVFGR
ncbi:MAG: DUF1320 family protein [Magnetococcales bacterium]|nr:DUF1320 family protein [Magnetococcales bacterium]